jgi:putative inorganic carbon (HCO3(-)) transporter
LKDYLRTFDQKYFFSILLAFSFALPFNTLTAINSILIAFLFLLWIFKIYDSEGAILFRTPLDVPLLGFFTWAGLSMLWTADFHESLNGWIALGKQIFLFYLVVTTVKTKDHFFKILFGFLAAMVLTDLFAVRDFINLGGNLLDRQVRAGSFASRDSHRLVTLLVIFIPMAFIYGTYFSHKLIKSILIIVFLLSTFVLFIGYTRGAWFAVVFQAFLFTFIYNRKLFYSFLIFSLLMVIIAFITIKQRSNEQVVIAQSEIYSDTLDPQNLNVRVDVWKFGIKQIFNNPVFGYGFGKEIFRKVNKDEKIVKPTPHLHNTFIETAFELGLPGLLLLLYCFGGLLQRSIYLFKHGNDTFFSLYAFYMIIMISGLLFRSIFDHMFIGNIAEIFWVLSGLLFISPSNPLSLSQKFATLYRGPNDEPHKIVPDSPFHA